MPRLNILSKLEQKEFDSPPMLSSNARRSIFRLNPTTLKYLDQIDADQHRVSFLLMYNYFKITKKFFLPENFLTKDIEYVVKQLGTISSVDNFDIKVLNKNSFKRYKLKILERSGFSSFDSSSKKLLYDKSYKLASNHIKPKIIFNDCIELLLNQKIELPKYYTISEIIRTALANYKEEILELLSKFLTLEHTSLLDGLLTYSDEKEIYKLTVVKSFNHSTRPKAIRDNINELKTIRNIYDSLIDLIKILPLNNKGIEYFATTVIKSDVFRVKRKSRNDKYLHLITFIIYQYSIMHDALMDIFLKAMGSFNSSSKREHQLRCYESREKLKTGIQEYLHASQKASKALKEIYDLYKDQNEDLVSKLRSIGDILDKLYESNRLSSFSFREMEHTIGSFNYSDILSEKSRTLQAKLSPILRSLRFDIDKSYAPELLDAIDFFQKLEGKISNTLASIPTAFLNKADKADVVVYDKTLPKKNQYKINVPLYKALLFKYVATDVKAGLLNLSHSYKYKAFDEYLVPKDEWDRDEEILIKQAGLKQFVDFEEVLKDLENVINQEYIRTNENIKCGANKHIKVTKINDYVLKTPALDSKENDLISSLSDYFPDSYKVPMQEVLFTVNEMSGFLDCFEYYKTTHQRQLSKKLLVAGIMSLGYGMLDNEIAHISKDIKSSALENVVNWCFTTENVQNAVDSILRLTDLTTIPGIYQEKEKKVHTASDGQKWKVVHDSLNANYSFKYYGQDQGVSVISFVDKKHLLFYSTVMSASLKESAYVIDGLMHNDVVKSEIHSTDTHGYSESVFAITHFLGIFAAPRIKNLKKQVLSVFPGYRNNYRGKKYSIMPTHTINVSVIKECWNDILRILATIKLKRSTASTILSRLNSYSKRNKIYRALKEFGKIIKSIFILRYIDNVELRQEIEGQLNLVENSNKFSKAVAQENEQSFIQQTQAEQIIAESCRRLMKAAIICWNCLFLQKKINEVTSNAEAQNIIDSIKAGSIMMWKHINFRGEYDFSEEVISDKYGLKTDIAKTLYPL